MVIYAYIIAYRTFRAWKCCYPNFRLWPHSPVMTFIIIIIIIVFVRGGGGGGGNVYKASTDETINYPITTNERIKVFSRN